MKRAGNLIGSIASPENLYLAFYKAGKGKRSKPDVRDFEKNLDCNLQIMSTQLLNDAAETGNYRYFTIFDPKIRQICAARFSERALHHAIMNICHPLFERHLIFDTYATRKNKGTYQALDRAKYFMKKYRWFAKTDVRKYFDSIDHKILLNQLSRLFKDKPLLALFEKIISAYQTEPGKGLPIGNLTSQYFANHYLSGADHYVLEKLKIPGYVRYMDDMVLFHNDRDQLRVSLDDFQSYLCNRLTLALKPPLIQNTVKGLPFLGYRLFRFTVKLNNRSKRRFRTKLAKYSGNLESGAWSACKYQAHVLPLIAFTRYADALELRKRCILAFEGQEPEARNVYCAAVRGTTTPTTAGRLTATGTIPGTTGTTTDSGLFLPVSSKPDGFPNSEQAPVLHACHEQAAKTALVKRIPGSASNLRQTAQAKTLPFI